MPTPASTTDEVRSLRHGPEIELFLEVRGIRKREPLFRGPRGEEAAFSLPALGLLRWVTLAPRRKKADPGIWRRELPLMGDEM